MPVQTLFASAPASSIVMLRNADEDACARKAAIKHDVSLVTLAAIRMVEGGRAGHLSWNTNGTADVGPWQINSMHFTRLKEQGVDIEALINDVCVNADIAAQILSEAQDGQSIGDGALSYHSRTPKYRAKYRKALLRAITTIEAHMKKVLETL